MAPGEMERRVRDLELLLATWAEVVTLMLDREIELRERLELPPARDDEDAAQVKQAAATIRQKRGLRRPPPGGTRA